MNKRTNLRGVDPMKARRAPRPCKRCKGERIAYFGKIAKECPACAGKGYQTVKDVRRCDAYWRHRNQLV